MSMVSGGKTLHLPGITSRKTVEPKAAVKSKKKMSAWVGMLLFVLPLSILSFSINLFCESQVEDMRSKVIGGPVGDGYKFSVEQINAPMYAGISIGSWLITLAIMVILMGVFTDFLERDYVGPFVLVSLACMIFALFGPGFFKESAHDDADNFGEWAKAKYSLSSLDGYNNRKEVLDAKESDGTPVKMNVYRNPDNVIYLYRTEQDLLNALSNSIAVSSKTNS